MNKKTLTRTVRKLPGITYLVVIEERKGLLPAHAGAPIPGQTSFGSNYLDRSR